MASSVEALAEAFEGTLRELRGFAGRFGCVFWFFVCVDVMICPRFWTTRVLFLNVFHRLRYCKDRA